MSNLVSIRDGLARRESRQRDRAADRAAHPALRWVAGHVFYIAHCRDETTGHAACGARGDLILAPPGVPQCVHCYPPGRSEPV